MFIKIIDNYRLELETLREFVNLKKQFTKKIKKTVKKDPISFLPKMIFDLEREIRIEDDPNIKKQKEEELKKFKEISKKYFSYEVDKEGKIVRFSALSNETIKKSRETFNSFEKSLIGNHFILKSTLINLLTAFENLLKKIIQEADSINSIDDNLDKKSITFADLKDIGSIKEARKLILEDYIETNFYNSHSEIVRFLEKVLKVNLSLGYQKNDFIEICERRNIFVHNNGRIGNKYLKNVDPSLIEKFKAKKNDKIILDINYVLHAIDIIEIVGLSVLYRVWKKLKLESKDRSIFISHFVIYGSLVNKNFLVAEYIAQLVLDDPASKQLRKDIAQVNRWQAIKSLGRFGEVEQEILAADFSSKSRLLKLGRLAILEDKKKFFPLLIEAFNTDDISMQDYLEFPVFEKMRKTKESKKLIIESKSRETNKIADKEE